MVLLTLSTLTSGPLVIQQQLKTFHHLGSSAPFGLFESRLDSLKQVHIAQIGMISMGFITIGSFIIAGNVRINTTEEIDLFTLLQIVTVIMYIVVPMLMVVSLALRLFHMWIRSCYIIT